MRLILKLIAAPFIVLLTILVTVLLFLFSVSSFLLTTASIIMALLGVGLFFINGRRHLSGDCVPAFALRLAGGDGRCYYGAEQLKPVSAAIHHKLIASGQVVPK